MNIETKSRLNLVHPKYLFLTLDNNINYLKNPLQLMVILNKPQFVELILKNEEIFGKVTWDEIKVVLYLSSILYKTEARELLEEWLVSMNDSGQIDLLYEVEKSMLNNSDRIDRIASKYLITKIKHLENEKKYFKNRAMVYYK